MVALVGLMRYAPLLAPLIAALLAALGAWQAQAWRYESRIAALQAQAQALRAERAEAARLDEQHTAAKESTHAADTSKNAEFFTASQPGREAAARADAARSDRLRTDAERRAATYRAMAEAGATACRDLADRHEALDRHVVEGVAVVGACRETLIRRDAEVSLLRRQIDVDRALLSE